MRVPKTEHGQLVVILKFDLTKHQFNLTKHQFNLTKHQFDLTKHWSKFNFVLWSINVCICSKTLNMVYETYMF